MIVVLWCIAMFVLVWVFFFYYTQNQRIYFEQKQLIKSLRGEARFLLKEHRRDKEMLDWADEVGHYDVRCKSLREELRSVMEKDEQEM